MIPEKMRQKYLYRALRERDEILAGFVFGITQDFGRYSRRILRSVWTDSFPLGIWFTNKRSKAAPMGTKRFANEREGVFFLT